MAIDGDFDFIVVGAGSAGATVARRLADHPQNRVLLLEAGGSDRHLYVSMPSGVGEIHRRRMFEWGYETVPQPELDGRRLPQPRGKILGGSSSINGMIFVRGHPDDYNRWAREGAAGWSYADVLPYFKKLENHSGRTSPYRGTDGPVSTQKGGCENPLFGAFIQAGKEAGYPVTEDCNGYQQEGFGPFDANISGGVRFNTSRSYLKSAPRNLHVVSHAQVDRVLFEGKRATGIVVEHSGLRKTVMARKGVVLSAGTVGSPSILMRSGIGQGDTLSSLGIAPVHNLAGVGRNLQDHLELQFDWTCTEPISLYTHTKWYNTILGGLRWLAFKNGPFAYNHLEAGAFLHSKAGVAHPDIQIHFMPVCMEDQEKFIIKRHGFRIHIGPLRSKSRGTVELSTSSLHSAPLIDPNHMSTQEDWEEMRTCFPLAREIFAQPAMAQFMGEEIRPGPTIASQDEIDAHIRRAAVSAHHLCGTCKMGVDASAVVGPDCAVHGISGLYVVDASVMPSITSGNLHAPTVMIAEKAADHILGKQVLAPVSLPFAKRENWATSQR